MRYQTVAEAYRDLEQASGRLALIDRLAALLAATPAELLPTVCYLCQGLIAPEFAGVDLGLAEKLAVRAVAAATGTGPEQVAASVRETGDLGQAAEQLLAVTAAAGRPAWRSRPWWTRCTRSPRPRGRARRAASWTCWPACSARPPRWRPATCCAWSPGACGWASARPPSWTRSRRCTRAGGPPGRCWNAPTTSAATSAGSPPRWSSGGLAAVEQIAGPPGQPGAGHARPAAVRRRRRSSPSWAGSARPSTSTTASGCRRTGPPTGQIELFTRRLERVATQFPDVVELLAAGLGPREAIVEGEVVAFDPAAGELRPFGEVMFRRRKHGISEAVRDVPVGLFCFELLYADGQDLTMLSYPQRRAALAEAITVVAPAAAHHRHPGEPPRPPWTRRSSRRSPTAAKGWCASR